MDIISTKAVEVSIQAVSPALILSTATKVGSSAHALGADKVTNPRTTHRDNLLIVYSPLKSNGARVPLARPDAYDVREVEHEDLPVAHPSGLSGFRDHLDHLIDQCVVHRNFNFCLGHELDRVFGAAIDLRMAPLPAEAANFRHRHALHAHVADRLPNIIQLEWFDNRRNELHRMTSLVPSLGL